MEVLRDGNHALHNLSDEEKKQLPISISGICACGAGPVLNLKFSPFDYHTAWYLCSNCHWQIDCFWQAEERHFEAVRSVLEAVALGSADMRHFKEKAAKLLSHKRREAYYTRQENEATIRKYLNVLDTSAWMHSEIVSYLVFHRPQNYLNSIQVIEKMEDALAEIKLALQEVNSDVGKG